MGVPHIKANNWGGIGYGFGYAQAQDDLCTIADSMLTYRGERSRYFGGDQVIPYLSTIGQPKNIDSDFFHQHVLNDTALKKMIAAQPDTIKQVVAGFTAGYNRYVREIKAGSDANAHQACRHATWVAPVTTDDFYRRIYATNFVAGYDNFGASSAHTAPPAPALASSAAALVKEKIGLLSKRTQLAIAKEIMRQFQVGGVEGVGSNMLGFGTSGTGDSSPLLFGNPHWYWQGPDRFYQAQLTIPQKLNVSGASFLGLPLIQMGYNNDIAWSHTVSTAKRYGIFQLTLAPGDPTSYMLDGQAVKMTARNITVQVRQSDGSVAPITRTLYETQYGPMIDLGMVSPQLGAIGGWSQGTAFAIRDVNGANYRSFRNWQRWSQAASLDEFIKIQREEAAIPWVNTVAVGRGSSDAWYADIGAVPNVSDARMARCATLLSASLSAVLAPAPVLDGSKGTCEWQSDADSVQPGAIGPSRMPSLLRKDYVMNSNDSYWLANADQPLSGYPSIMGTSGTRISFRSRLGHILARGRLAGTDGLGGAKATSETVRAMTLNSRSLAAEVLKDDLLKMLCSPPVPITVGEQSVDPTEACAVLQAWDNKATINSRGAHLWDEFFTLAAAALPVAALYQVQFDSSDPLNTPRGLNPEAKTELQQALGGAIQRVQASGFALDAPRGDYLFVTRGNDKIPLYGGCPGLGYYTVVCSANGIDPYPMDNPGPASSYMQVVRFPAGAVEAYTFLTHSLSDDPASPHYGDYTRAFSRGEWQKMPFSEAEIAGDPALVVKGISQ
jgi:acyl-homoserine-lactone acylase